MFRGSTNINLDAKGRLAMPSRYREELIDRCNGEMVITIDLVDPCLSIYPLADWEQLEAKLRTLPSLDEQNRRLFRLLIGNAVDVSLDASSRLLIPPRLREWVGLDKSVVLMGQLEKFQLWDEAEWEKRRADDFNSVQTLGGLSDELRKTLVL